MPDPATIEELISGQFAPSSTGRERGAGRKEPERLLFIEIMKLSDLFHPAAANWFADCFAAPTPPQAKAWPAIEAGRHTLIAAPTGSGKTLAAFLAAIDDLVCQGLAGELADATQVVYVSLASSQGNSRAGRRRGARAGDGLSDVTARCKKRGAE
jgi:DEAD/DEAH box helicase